MTIPEDSTTKWPDSCSELKDSEPGDEVRTEDARIVVERMHGRRIERLRWCRAPPMQERSTQEVRADERRLVRLVWLVVLLLGNSFFVGAEFAVVAAKRSQIEPRAAEGSAAAKTALYAMEHVSLMLAICQLGITVCSLLLGNVAEPAIHHLLAGPLEGLGIPAGLSSTISFILALGVVTYLHVVIGEMVPKNLALAAPARP